MQDARDQPQVVGRDELIDIGVGSRNAAPGRAEWPAPGRVATRITANGTASTAVRMAAQKKGLDTLPVGAYISLIDISTVVRIGTRWKGRSPSSVGSPNRRCSSS
jgi:hypothetical protein